MINGIMFKITAQDVKGSVRTHIEILGIAM